MLSFERMEGSDREAVVRVAKRLRLHAPTRWANRASKRPILLATCACALFMVTAVMGDDGDDANWTPAVAPLGFTTLPHEDHYTHAHTHSHARALVVRQVPSPPSPTGILQLFRVSSAVKNRALDHTSHLLDDRQFLVPGLQPAEPSSASAVSSMRELTGNVGGWRIRRRGPLSPTSPLPAASPTAGKVAKHTVLKPVDIFIESGDEIKAVARRARPVAVVSTDSSVSDVYIATDNQLWRTSEGVQSEWMPVSDWTPVPGTRVARRGPAAGTLPGGLEWARSRLMAGKPVPVLTFASHRHDTEDGDGDNATKPDASSWTTETTLSSTSEDPTTEQAKEDLTTKILDEDNEVDDGKKKKKDENRETTYNGTTKEEEEAGEKNDAQHWLTGRERYEICLRQLQSDLHLSEEAADDPRVPAPPLLPDEEAHAQRRLIRCVAEQLVAAVRELVQRFEHHLARTPDIVHQGRSNKQGGLGGWGGGLGEGEDVHGHRRKKKKKQEELKVPAILMVPLLIQLLVVPPMLFMLGTSAIQALVSGKLALLLTIGRWLMLRMTRSDHDVYNEGLVSEHYGYGGTTDPLGTEFGSWVNGW